jgi:hypothetical protein
MSKLLERAINCEVKKGILLPTRQSGTLNDPTVMPVVSVCKRLVRPVCVVGQEMWA